MLDVRFVRLQAALLNRSEGPLIMEVRTYICAAGVELSQHRRELLKPD